MFSSESRFTSSRDLGHQLLRRCESDCSMLMDLSGWPRCYGAVRQSVQRIIALKYQFNSYLPIWMIGVRMEGISLQIHNKLPLLNPIIGPSVADIF
ncbi:hypothetical protein NPIL_362891 [Nephila pilipes]|uniref:Uncharacterized protein n=1 Tax=Nephila pilipes TaxID=299642 RepID=A0A8X6P326_NEPPI|nr:hypothetical protein NPIL_362891 [Nephila pilipes]